MTYGIVGDKAQGKTTFVCAYADQYNEVNNVKYNRNKRVLIHDPSEAKGFRKYVGITLHELKNGVFNPETGKRHYWRKGIRRLINEQVTEKNKNRYFSDTVRTISTTFKGGLLIFDDATTWVNKDKPPDWQKDFIVKHRNYDVDVIFIFHSLMSIPREFRAHIWKYIIFKIPEVITKAKWFQDRQFPNPSGMFQAYKEAASMPHKPFNGKPLVQAFGKATRNFDAINFDKAEVTTESINRLRGRLDQVVKKLGTGKKITKKEHNWLQLILNQSIKMPGGMAGAIG